MAGEWEDDIPESGAVFTFGKSKFAENIPSKFWLKNDVPVKISCGDEHTALITENGKLFMFGSNNWGQLGLGSKVTIHKPTCVKALKLDKVRLVSCGRNHTLICTVSGSVLSCGGNGEGQLGHGDLEERTSFQKIAFFDLHGPIKMLAAGSNTSAALTDGGQLFMWGDNSEGQIGLGKESHAPLPQEVGVGRPISWVSCGYYHSALVTVDGALYTFGERDSGKLGLSTDQLTTHRVPQKVKAIVHSVTQVSCGGGHTVALTDDGVYTFGLGQYGQLGHGTFIFESRLPRQVEHFQKGRVQGAESGENHTAVVTDSGLLYTFGDGRHGKLGLGEENFTNQFKPTLCSRFLKYNVLAATCGGCHMVVLARPRDRHCVAVTMEDDDVTHEDYLERWYRGGANTDPAPLGRSLSARVRRRERECSPEQFGSIFRTLPPGYLAVPSPPVPPRQTPPPPTPSSTHETVKNKGSEADVVMEILTDIDSVSSLGGTTDFLNMTHQVQFDPGDKTLTLSPVQKRKGKNVKAHNQKTQRSSSNQSRSPSHKSVGVSLGRALPTELLRSSSACSLTSATHNRRTKTHKGAEEPGGTPHAGKPAAHSGASTPVASQQRWFQGKQGLAEEGDTNGAATGKKTPSIKVENKRAVAERSRRSGIRRGLSESDFSRDVKTSKNEKNKKEAQTKNQSDKDQDAARRLRLLPAVTAAAVTAASALSLQKTESESGGGAFKSESYSEGHQKPGVSINIIPAAESSEGGTSQDERQSEEPKRGTRKSVKVRQKEEERNYATVQRQLEENQSMRKSDKGDFATVGDEEEDEEESQSEEKEMKSSEETLQRELEEEEDEEQKTSGDISEEEEDDEEQKTSGDISEEEEDDEEQKTSGDISEEEEDDEEQKTSGDISEEEEDDEEQKTSGDISEEEEDDEEQKTSGDISEEEEDDEEQRTSGDVSEEEEDDEEQRTSGDVSEEEEDEKSDKKITEDNDEDSDGLYVEEEEEGSTGGTSHETESKGEEEEEEREEEEEEEREEEEEEREEEEEEEREEEEEEREEEEEEREEEEEEREEEEEEEREEEEEEREEEEEEEREEEEEEREEEEEEEREEEEEEEEEREEEEEEREEEEEEEREEEEEEREEEEEEEREEEEEEEEREEEEEEREEEEEEREEEEEEREEEEEEESEKFVKQKKSSGVKGQINKSASEHKHRSGVKGQTAGEEEEEFWDDVLPQYLHLK